MNISVGCAEVYNVREPAAALVRDLIPLISKNKEDNVEVIGAIELFVGLLQVCGYCKCSAILLSKNQYLPVLLEDLDLLCLLGGTKRTSKTHWF